MLEDPTFNVKGIDGFELPPSTVEGSPQTSLKIGDGTALVQDSNPKSALS
jgi:hypothetical protein